jgi:NAD(P)-dependent dehydrogenase (short-subunit alcohol dehydrogenase family)
MIRIGRGIGRKAVRDAVERGDAATVIYDDVLEEQDIRETLAGIRDAGMPRAAVALLAWLASHPNSPEDVLRDLFSHGTREVLVSLAMNRKLPPDLRRFLLDHADEDVRAHANHTFLQIKKH